MAGVFTPSEKHMTNDPSAEFQDWLKQRRFSHTEFTIPALAAAVREKHYSVTVIIPGKEVASTIANVITKTTGPLVAAKIVSSVIVVDAASKDGTGNVAAAYGARVIQRADIAPEFGSSRGKGDALWRGLLATEGDIVAFLDGDTSDPSPAHLVGILGPLLLFSEVQMVRACFDRPFKSAGGDVRPHEGGRVTEILARPLLNMYWPDLAGFRQPLAGEFAARRSLLECLSFPVGYGIEIGTLVDTFNMFGLNGLAEVDVGQRQNAHKPLRELTIMAKAILSTAEKRLERGKLSTGRMFLPWENDYCEVDDTERPPLQEYRRGRSTTVSSSSEADPLYPSPPFVIVEGVRMFRDLGGYMTDGGYFVKQGLVYRSGEPSRMTRFGKQAFLKLGIRKVFDFRSPVEIHSEHAVDGADDTLQRKDSAAEFSHAKSTSLSVFDELLREENIERVAVPVFSDEDWQPEKRDARLKHYASAADGYAKAYHHTLIRGAHAFRPIFEHLAQSSPSPILVHCTAGKDRTGVTAMLVLLLAGCDASTIAKEYALNNLDSNRQWGVSATSRLLSQPGLSGNVEAVDNVVQAREEYMHAAIELFNQELGGVEEYMAKFFGFDYNTILSIKRNLVV